MENKELYEVLFQRFEKELNFFEEKTNKFFSILANPGSGKTYNLIKTLELYYGKYYTKNPFQKYINDDGNELYIPAGEGNLALEDSKKFQLKTNSGEDVIFPNTNSNTLIISYNTAIKKEFDKKVKNSKVLKLHPDKLEVRTSHSLLFKMAEKLDLFPKRNQNGEYIDEKGRKVNFAKGSFSFQDAKKIVNDLKTNTFSFLKNLSSKEQNKIAKILIEIINTYYQNDLVINKIDDVEILIDLAKNKLFDIEENIRDYFNNLYPNADFQKDLFYLNFIITAVKSLKKLINSGQIELCHDFYYKEVYIKCMRNKQLLPQLFSIDNNEKKYFNIIMVDEAQDLTPIMARLLIEYYKYTKQNHLDVVFTIVGDRKQAIYSFANRVDAFEIIEKNLGKEKVEYFTLNKSYRLSPAVCNFTNNLTKKIGIYSEKEKIIPAYNNKKGFVAEDVLDLKELSLFFVNENINMFVLGRTNIEIIVNYIDVYFYIKKYKPEYLKYLKVDSKIKSNLKKILEKGLNNIDDKNLLDKLRILTGKENIALNDLKKEEVKEKLPLYLQNLIDLQDKYTNEEILEALNNRPSPKANIKFITLHASKGLECENIYLLDGIIDNLDLTKNKNISVKKVQEFFNKFKEKKDNNKEENINLIEKKDKDNEIKMEKFLLYVGVSRAKNNLFLDEKLFNHFKSCIKNETNDYLFFKNSFEDKKKDLINDDIILQKIEKRRKI